MTERPDGTLEVVLAVSEPAWLERLLLRLGPEAEVVDPPALRARRGRRPRAAYSPAIPKSPRATPALEAERSGTERVGTRMRG